LRDAVRRHPDVALGALAQLSETISRLSDEMEELRFLDLDQRRCAPYAVALAARGKYG
jgi:hypothetical protein